MLTLHAEQQINWHLGSGGESEREGEREKGREGERERGGVGTTPRPVWAVPSLKTDSAPPPYLCAAVEGPQTSSLDSRRQLVTAQRVSRDRVQARP